LTKTFSQLDRHAFSISIISRARMHQEKALAAEQEISESFSKINNDLDLHIERLKHVYKKSAIDEHSAMSNPLEIKAKITTRLSMEYLALIEKLDFFLCMFEPLVILGQISYEQRQTVTFQWQDRMNKLATRVRLMAQEIRSWHKDQKEEVPNAEFDNREDRARQ